jgi:lysophospholipase L1-like esterase
VDRVLLLGDSLTAGHPGVGYPGMMARLGFPRELAVEGRGGATVTEVRWRLNPMIARHSPGAVLVEVGANDILIPHFHRRGGSWKKLAMNLQFRGNVPMTTPEAFMKTFGELLESVPTGVEVVLATVACLGEVPGSELNRARNRYNEVIRNLARKHGAGLADTAEAFDRKLRNLENPSPYFMDRHSSDFLQTVITAPDAGADYLSRRRGLHLTMDGAHLNSRGARLYALTVMAALSRETSMGGSTTQ